KVVVIVKLDPACVFPKSIRGRQLQSRREMFLQPDLKSLVSVVRIAAVDIDRACRALIARIESGSLRRAAKRNDRMAYKRHDAGVWIHASNFRPVVPVAVELIDTLESPEMHKPAQHIVRSQNKVRRQRSLKSGVHMDRVRSRAIEIK